MVQANEATQNMHPPPHMTCMHPPLHMTCMHPPPHMTCMHPPHHMTCMHPPHHMTCMHPPPHMTCMHQANEAMQNMEDEQKRVLSEFERSKFHEQVSLLRNNTSSYGTILALTEQC